MILDLFRKEIGFENIQGDDIKDIVKRAIDAEDNYNLLFVGSPASAKTLFLLGILESRKGVYFDGSNTTNRILDVLEEKRPKIICIDERDKMPIQFQEKLLCIFRGESICQWIGMHDWNQHHITRHSRRTDETGHNIKVGWYTHTELNSSELRRILEVLEEQGLLFRDEGQVISLVLTNFSFQDMHAIDDAKMVLQK
jgi:hypothetical protein